MIDTAQGYPNSEPQVAKAISESGIPRAEIFIMTKLHPRFLGYETTLEAIEMSLKSLKTDYIDLFLIHSQACDDFLLICGEGKFFHNYNYPILYYLVPLQLTPFLDIHSLIPDLFPLTFHSLSLTTDPLPLSLTFLPLPFAPCH